MVSHHLHTTTKVNEPQFYPNSQFTPNIHTEHFTRATFDCSALFSESETESDTLPPFYESAAN